jgi:hypothetical protein
LKKLVFGNYYSNLFLVLRQVPGSFQAVFRQFSEDYLKSLFYFFFSFLLGRAGNCNFAHSEAEQRPHPRHNPHHPKLVIE